MEIDPDEFRPLVAKFGLSQNGENDLIHMVTRIMANGIDRAYGHDPVQMALQDQSLNAGGPAREEGPVVDLEKDEYQALELSEEFNDQKGEQGS